MVISEQMRKGRFEVFKNEFEFGGYSDGEPINKIVLDEEKDSYSEGETIGKCEVYLNEQKIGEVELYCDRDVEKGGFFDNLKYNMKNLFKKGV